MTMRPNIRAYIRDTFQNLVSGLGTTKDKNFSNRFAATMLNQGELELAYRGDWVARKVVDIPPFDMTREWRAWQADKKAIERIEAEEQRLCIQHSVKEAMQWARLYGGALLVIGTDDEGTDKELKADQIKQGSIKYVHAVSRYGGLSAGELVRDVTSPYYNQPEHYMVQHTLGGVQVKVHPSRVVRFVGMPVPDAVKVADSWGDSVLQVVYDAIQNVAMSSAAGAALVHEAKTDVVKLPDFMANIGTGEYKSLLIERFQLANTAKSIVQTLILDKEEEWNRIETNFAGLPDLLQLYLLIASGAADIPATRMLGQSPAGLNSTGESDLRNYYDRVRAEQTTMLSPTLRWLDELLIRSALGTRDPTIHYIWNSLWQLTAEQKADIALKKAQAFQIDATVMLIDQDALKKGRENQLIEDGTYPGFDLALQEAEIEQDLDEDEEDTENQFAEDRKRRIRDARPRSLYARRDVLNAGEILTWARTQGFQVLQPGDELHVTIAYSKEPVDWIKIGQPYEEEIFVKSGGPRLVEMLGGDGAVVIMFACLELSWRHEQMKDCGAVWSYEHYQPHITFTYEKGDVDLEKVVPYRGKIHLGPEVFEEIKQEFVPAGVLPAA